MSPFITWSSISVLLLISSVSGNPESTLHPNVQKKLEQTPFHLDQAVTSFHNKLYGKLSAAESGNIIYSPFSLHMLLSQVYAGSPTGSETSKELSQLLDFRTALNEDYLYNYLKVINGHSSDTKVALDIANRIFAANDLQIKPDFKTALETFYESSIENVNFGDPKSAVNTINKFVNDKTQGLIDKIFEEDAVDALSRLVLINAIYFKGNWKFPFQQSDTETLKFHVDAGRETDFSGMKLDKKLSLINSPELNADVLELPYEDDKLSMIVILPASTSTVRDVESKLNSFDLLKVLSALQNIEVSQVNLLMPKFDAEFEWSNLEENLQALGVRTLFDAEKANLTDIANEDQLYVSKVAHKAIIKVNEEGTEAAAVSGSVISTRVEFAKKADFIVDRPFLFVIVDKVNKVPLFAGRIVDPNGKLKLQ